MADTFAVQVMKKLRGVREQDHLATADQLFIDHLDINTRRAGGQLTKGVEIGIAVTLFDEIHTLRKEIDSVMNPTEVDEPTEASEKATPE